MKDEHEGYESVFSWRYGSAEMRALWSEHRRRRLMRDVWLALAEAQEAAGLVTPDQLADLRRTRDDVDVARVAALEAETRHDVVAELRAWSEKAPVGGRILHLGATSADITDNVDALRVRDGLAIARRRLTRVIRHLAGRVEETADLVTLGWTHLQPAAPTTVGYRLAATLQDFVTDLGELDHLKAGLAAKGFKGAVGTRATYASLLAGRGATAEDMEADAMRRLGLRAAEVTTQVYPRKGDWLLLNALAGIAASASTFAFNVRLLQSPPHGEWSEGFRPGQIGSSAMPWKRNPIVAENVNSLARLVAALPAVAWQNEALSLLERTLDDSANRRVILAEAFLAVDEILARTARLVADLEIDAGAVRRALERFGPFAAVESLLMAATAGGGDRQALHERLRRHSMVAWEAVARGETNPLADLAAGDPLITAYVKPDRVAAILARPEDHIGDAPRRARELAQRAIEMADAAGPVVAA